MHIGLLGAFEVRSDNGTPADVPGARLPALLVALALPPGRVVPKAALIDWIWGEHPPTDATNALQRLVSRTNIHMMMTGNRTEVEHGGGVAERVLEIAAQHD